MRITEIDDAPDGQPIVEMIHYGRTYYLHRTPSGNFNIMDATFTEICHPGWRDMVEFTRTYIREHWL